MNPRPLAGCEWTSKKATTSSTEINRSDGTGTGEEVSVVGSGLARARATVKPSADTARDRRHYKRNALFAEVFFSFRTQLHLISITLCDST